MKPSHLLSRGWSHDSMHGRFARQSPRAHRNLPFDVERPTKPGAAAVGVLVAVLLIAIGALALDAQDERIARRAPAQDVIATADIPAGLELSPQANNERP